MLFIDETRGFNMVSYITLNDLVSQIGLAYFTCMILLVLVLFPRVVVHFQ
jgi:hypothetical protein